MQIRDVMTSEPVCCTSETTIATVARMMVDHDCGATRVIVVDHGGACIGIVAQADVARCASKRETGDLVREVSRRGEPAFVS